ncbi:oligosaccharide flippase family protein [Microvirga tunisiensis]|uniref:Oligosaccharide flippase family protein n=2 Tax=Pannonibacter tanglangensis TaxID=2750084 RepID=A0ABW9ZCK6_9HYPH|nr:oligosaccharide flippase family protein [Pannonibacter sp. XCT-34]
MFIVAARFLGPSEFGIFAGAVSYCMLLNLLTDFGLVTYSLRQAGSSQELTVDIVRRALLVKTVVTLLAILGATPLVLLFAPDPAILKVLIFAFPAITLAAYADLAFVAARANSRFDIERNCIVWTSTLHLALVCVTAVVTNDSVATSAALLVSRLIYVFGAVHALRRWLLAQAPWPTASSELWQTTRSAVPYAIDGALTNVSNQIDVVMVTLLMDPASVGIYLAGARLVQSIAPVATILSNVYLPRLSQAYQRRKWVELRVLSRRLNIEFGVLALCSFLGFYFFGPIWTNLIYGPEFSPLIELWPGFAIFASVRILAASFGIHLAAFNEIYVRVLGQTAALSITVVAFLALGSSMNNRVAIIILVIVNVSILFMYALRVISIISRKKIK